MAGPTGFIEKEKRPRSLSYRLHDALNVPLVGALSVLCVAGIAVGLALLGERTTGG